MVGNTPGAESVRKWSEGEDREGPRDGIIPKEDGDEGQTAVMIGQGRSQRETSGDDGGDEVFRNIEGDGISRQVGR
jgi:hypothetical protein